MKQILNLSGLKDCEDYNAWSFPGGELHFKLKSKIYNDSHLVIKTILDSPTSIILLMLAIDTIRKEGQVSKLSVQLNYMPYAQADRDFAPYESFSLKTITTLFNSLQVDEWILFDPHSDVAPALLNKVKVIPNDNFIKFTLSKILKKHPLIDESQITILSPDAGAYKKIFSLCKRIDFKGKIVTASKSRDHQSGQITTTVPYVESGVVLIIDDICLGGRTFMNISKELNDHFTYLAISHGIFNEGIDHLSDEFYTIFTTDSVGQKFTNDNLIYFNL